MVAVVLEWGDIMSKHVKRKSEFDVEVYRRAYDLVSSMGVVAAVVYSCYLMSTFGINIFSLFGGFF